MFIFFFQAEDGIRDVAVTGVQTCALPIYFGERIAVFEATHGSAPRYRGTDRANPMALMLSGAMMLRHLGEIDAGDRLEAAVRSEERRVGKECRARGSPYQ